MVFVTMRRYERIAFSMDLEAVDQSGKSWPGRSIDLSRGGIGLFCEKFLPEGSRVRLVIHLRGIAGAAPQVARVNVTVMQARIESEGAIMGCKFDKDLTPSEQPLLCRYTDAN